MASAITDDYVPMYDYSRGGLTPAEMSKLLVPQLPPGVDPTKMKLAYGRRAIPKMIQEFARDSLFDNQKSLVFMARLLHNPENVSQALSEGIVPLLMGCVTDVDLCIKQQSTECMSILANHAVGRAALVAGNVLTSLAKLMDDPDDLVRKNLHEVIMKVAKIDEGVQGILVYNLLPMLVAKVSKERMDVQVLILETLYSCLRHGKEPWIPREAINCDAMAVLTNLLKNEPVTETKVAAAKCVMMLSFHKVGKELATKTDTINVLILLLSDRKSEVRAAAAGALMSITIDCDAKKHLVRENAVGTMIELLDDKNPSVLLNVIKLITNVAEDYRGRFQLHSCVKKLETFYDSPNKQLSQAARRAVQVITWRP
ncbi:Radial spoke head 14 [Blyttiomyces sp. JEL0837]|nr:Radial spoke head 14 [Blyttiomyces sp. JEL0837]